MKTMETNYEAPTQASIEQKGNSEIIKISDEVSKELAEIF
jgi:hypothetical protein